MGRHDIDTKLQRNGEPMTVQQETTEVPEYLVYHSTKVMLEKFWASYLEMEKDPDSFRPVPALLPALTHKMGGFGKGMFVVFGAPPKGGKSAALLSCVSYISKVKPNALIGFISNEMWEQQLTRAFLSNISYVDRSRMKNIELDTGEKRKIDEAIRDFGQGINCAWGYNITTFEDLHKWIRNVEEHFGQPMEFIIIDYIHLMDGEGRTMTEKVPWITRQMKKLTHIFPGICVISASQLNNEHIKNENYSHTAFLYGGVDRDADAGIIIAPFKDESDRVVEGLKILHLPVVREGRGGEEKVAFRGEYALITGTQPEPREDIDELLANLEFAI